MEEKTAVVQARVDYLTMASLAKFLTNEGQRPQSKSDLVWKATELLLQVLETAGRLERFTSIYEAAHFMEIIGLGNMSLGGKNRRAFSKAMQVEALSEEGFSRDYIENMKFKSPKSPRSEEPIDPAQATLDVINEARARDGRPPLEEVPFGPFEGWRPPKAEPPRMKVSEEELQRQLKIARSAPNALRVDSDDSAPISSEAFAQREAEVLAQLRGSLAAPMAQGPKAQEEEGN